ncbi:MAG: thermopsin family protease, partial [Thermoproteus sp.]|nr:thermopsin family protease [Thermoproteus sp.]
STFSIDKSAVKGKGAVRFMEYEYVMPGSIPFGHVELEMRTRVDDGKIIVEFYANGQKYDNVTITPYAPAASAYIEIAPTTTPIGAPLDLELVLGGYNDTIPFTVLNAGRIGLKLYVHMNGAWIPPPSAWSIGSALGINLVFGYSSARVEPQDVGSVLVVPGSPNSRRLWAGTIIATPIGINATNSTDLSPYIRSLVDFGNNTRLVLTGAYVNGRPAQLSSLSNVTLGSLVVLQYKRQYFISISAPGNFTAGWFDENSTIVINEPPVVDFGNGTRSVNPLVNGTRPPLVVVVDRPLVVSYTRQYLVSLNSPINNTAVWANASSAVVLSLPPVVDFGNNTRLIDPLINGTRPPLTIEVNRPMSFVGTYTKQYLVTYSGPVWLNRTWINAGASATFNPPQIIDFGNDTRLINPFINGAKPPLSITIDKPISLSVEYTRQYLVSIRTPFNETNVWINAAASYAPPASTISTNGVRLIPAYLTIDGRRAPLAPVPVEAPLNITVHYNAYAEVPTTFAGLPALYADASIACGGASNSTSGFFASSLRLELADVPAGTCSVSAHGVPSLALVAAAVAAAIVVLFRKLHKRS